MNPETHEIKRGPGRPRKEQSEPAIVELPPPPVVVLSLGELAASEIKPAAEITHPTQSLGDLYSAIDSAPREWLPSLLAKIVKTSLKSGAWSDAENLILSVRGFSK